MGGGIPDQFRRLRRWHARESTTHLHRVAVEEAREGGARTRVVLGHEFSGMIAAVGRGADGFNVGDEIYGMSDWLPMAPPRSSASLGHRTSRLSQNP